MTALKTHSLGFPRIGYQRELKLITESFWKGKSTESELNAVASTLRKSNWNLQKQKGIELVPRYHSSRIILISAMTLVSMIKYWIRLLF